MTQLSALVLIAILVIIHEFGHFIVAKACGVQCDVFSVGFGRTVFSIKGKETEYKLGMLPFGGYVKMAGADPFTYGSDQDAVDPSRAFSRKNCNW